MALDLDAIRAEAEKRMTPEDVENYGDALFAASLHALGEHVPADLERTGDAADREEPPASPGVALPRVLDSAGNDTASVRTWGGSALGSTGTDGGDPRPPGTGGARLQGSGDAEDHGVGGGACDGPCGRRVHHEGLRGGTSDRFDKYQHTTTIRCRAVGLGADLTNCDLSNRNLTGVDLNGAILKDSNLGYSDLSGANLRTPSSMEPSTAGATSQERRSQVPSSTRSRTRTAPTTQALVRA